MMVLYKPAVGLSDDTHVPAAVVVVKPEVALDTQESFAIATLRVQQ